MSKELERKAMRSLRNQIEGMLRSRLDNMLGKRPHWANTTVPVDYTGTARRVIAELTHYVDGIEAVDRWLAEHPESMGDARGAA